MRRLAGCLKPSARAKFAPQHQDWFVEQISDVKHCARFKAVPIREHGQGVDRIQESPLPALVARWHDRQMNFSASEAIRLDGSSPFYQLNLYTRVA